MGFHYEKCWEKQQLMESGSDWSRVWENRFGSCATPIIPIPDFRWKTRMGLDPTDPALDPGRTWGMDD